MKYAKFLIVLFISLGGIHTSAKDMKDTLYTSDRDRIIISYELDRTDSHLTVQFTNVQKKLSTANSEKFKKLNEVVVLFFDRTGNYRDMTFSNMVPEAFMIPSNIDYEKSDCGYFLLQDHLGLSFKTGKNDEVELSIPIYLAHYEGKRRYKLFAKSQSLKIKSRHDSSLRQSPDGQSGPQGNSTTIEIEEDNNEITEVLSCISAVTMLLATQERLPFSDGLQYEITRLRLMKDKVTDAEVGMKISEALTMCEAKKNELENKAAEEERQQKMAAEREKARQDSIAATEQLQAKKEKERNVWMIAGGVVLAVLCFVGNQVFQHFRSMKNQKNMLEMQQSIAQQAENEAKRRARNLARSQTKQVVNNTMRKGKDAVRKKTIQLGSKTKPKNISI